MRSFARPAPSCPAAARPAPAHEQHLGKTPTRAVIERVAQLTGFRDPERMRLAFIRAFGQPPQSLRRAARAG